MYVRAIALAVPVALGMACSHASQQGKTGTGAMSTAEQPSGSGPGREPLAQDPIMRPGPPVQGHADDQIVIGKIASVTGDAVSIDTAQGDSRTLQIAPETMIELDGREASAEDLTEGVPVRASYDVVDGQEVAVKIRAGDTAVSGGSTGSQDTGSADAQEQGTGSSAQDSGTGSADSATDRSTSDPGAAPDAGWGPPPDTGASGTGSAVTPQR